MRIVSTMALFLVSATAVAHPGPPEGGPYMREVGASGPAPTLTFPRGAPEAQGISSAALLDFVEQADQKLDALHSLMIVRRGHVVAEGWWKPYAADEPHMMFSLSKSFTSTAVGLAVAEGKLRVDDLVLSFFADAAPAKPSANLKAMRVVDLLTMTTGHHDEDIGGFPFASDEDLVKKFLALPVTHRPGTFFVYNTPATYMLSAIVQKVTGQTVLEYLRPRLFQPLGIENPTWDESKQGITAGGFGLWARTEDIARFGQLYLQRGEWQGRQLVPREWVERATSRQVSNGSAPSSDWEQGYGFQFWRSRHGFYRADGAHGQFCLILPQYDTVVAITSGTRDMASVMNLVWDRLVPALGSDALPADDAARDRLERRLASLSLPTVTGMPPSNKVKALVNRTYRFPTNALNTEAIALRDLGRGDGTTLAVKVNGRDQRIAAAAGAWQKGTLLTANGSDPIAATGAWTDETTFTMKLSRYRTAFISTYRLQFSDDRLVVAVEHNVGPADSRVTRIVGTSDQKTDHSARRDFSSAPSPGSSAGLRAPRVRNDRLP
jgi:CubicO group peptidase (beta-lactamase class C family)